LRKVFRTFQRATRDSEVWPVVLLLLAVLVPAVGLLWFTGVAMRNERLAARQKLADAYRVQLSASQARLQQHWRDTAGALEKLAATSAPVAFAECAGSGLVDGLVVFDDAGRVAYPNAPSAVHDGLGELEPKWQEASRLEQARNLAEAAKQFHALAQEATNANIAARSFQAEARCLVQAGRHDAVIQLISDVFGNERFRHAADAQGRLIAANVELMALEFITNRNSLDFQSLSRRLAARLVDYQNPVLAAPQRRFLMNELQTLEGIEFPTLAAEFVAAEVVESHPQPARNSVLQHGAFPDLWQFTTPDQRVLAVIRSDKLLAGTKAALTPDPSLADVRITLAPPDVDSPDAFVTLPAGERMPGWRLALSLVDREFFDATTGAQTAVYRWTAIWVVVGMAVLTVIAVRLVRRQMTLARLKNDLAATVSHELKTPLASMRVLVETLLDSAKLDEPRTREYLRLIAQENERLGRLIQNFLTFSRMERRKHQFHFSLLPAGQIAESAVESVRGRFETPGCRLELRIEDNLPPVTADPDALGTALSNLLENAYKYSEEIKHVVLHVRAENGAVKFSVKDNGIGIAPRDRRRIFQPFHQVDQALSRKGSGCGLGLSIVQFIATAHHGSVSVESQPGRGSTFTISLPAASAAKLAKEAIA